jgi:nucleoside-diphosphate-sugar epimerase
MKVLVTGANGFIGSHLTRLLVKEQYEVVAMVMPGTSLDNINGLDVQIVYADITKPEMLVGAMEKVDLVYHLAAMPSLAWSKRIFEVNFDGTKNVLEAAVKAKVKRFVYMSSLVVHGFADFNNADELTPKLTPNFFTRPYIASKVRGEELIANYNDKIETVVIRPGFTIYGPNDPVTSGELLKRISGGGIMGYIDKGNVKSSYVYVENLAYGLYKAGMSSEAVGQTYNIADVQPPYLTFKLLLEKFAIELGVKSKLYSFPSWLVFPIALVSDVMHRLFFPSRMPLLSSYIIQTATHELWFNTAKAEREIGYHQVVDFQEGIRRTVAWYQTYVTK